MEQHENLSTQPPFAQASDQTSHSPLDSKQTLPIVSQPTKKECAGGGDCKNCPFNTSLGSIQLDG